MQASYNLYIDMRPMVADAVRGGCGLGHKGARVTALSADTVRRHPARTPPTENPVSSDSPSYYTHTHTRSSTDSLSTPPIAPWPPIIVDVSARALARTPKTDMTGFRLR